MCMRINLTVNDESSHGAFVLPNKARVLSAVCDAGLVKDAFRRPVDFSRPVDDFFPIELPSNRSRRPYAFEDDVMTRSFLDAVRIYGDVDSIDDGCDRRKRINSGSTNALSLFDLPVL